MQQVIYSQSRLNSVFNQMQLAGGILSFEILFLYQKKNYLGALLSFLQEGY